MASTSSTAVDKRRLILDAAVRVFARQGFHTCRVSDIADEAGVGRCAVERFGQLPLGFIDLGLEGAEPVAWMLCVGKGPQGVVVNRATCA